MPILANTTHLRQLYPLIKALKNKSRNRTGLPHSIVDINDVNITDPSLITRVFAEHFEKQHSLTNNLVSIHDTEVVNSINLLNSMNPSIPFCNLLPANLCSIEETKNLTSNLPSQYQNLLTNTEELQIIINQKINKKSSGTDHIPIHTFKFLEPNIILFLVTFFNQLIAAGYFPQTWKHAIITPIPNTNKDPKFVKNWRPISQLKTISKLFGKIIDSKLSVQLNNILPNFQFGFTNKKSTIHPLTRFTSDVVIGLNHGRVTTAISLDLQSAFDIV